MKLAKFVNFTDDPFGHPSLGGHDDVCQWNREPYYFPPHSEQTMEDWKAAHFAKHLTNRELIKMPPDEKGVNVGEYHTSPKFPEQDAMFMGFYNQCYMPVEMEDKTPEKLMDEVIKEEVKEKGVKPVWCDKCGSLGVRHKKGCPVLNQKTAEEEFEGYETAK